MIDRNNGESQSKKAVDEVLDKMKPVLEEMIDNYEPQEEVREIENIDDLTVDEFYDPKMNKSFVAHNSTDFQLDTDGNISFVCTLYDEPENVIGEYRFTRESLGKAFEDYNIVMLAMISEIQDLFIEFRISPVVDVFFQSFRDKISNEKLEEIDEASDNLYYKKIRGSKSVDAVLAAIENMNK